MTNVSAFWLERYTPPTPIPYCQQGAGVFEKLAPLSQKLFLRQCMIPFTTWSEYNMNEINISDQ